MTATDDLDWKELTDEQQEAAKSLGYTLEIWDGSGTIPLEEKDWQELSADEQHAAEKLGYNRKSWNSSDKADDLDWDDLNDEQLKAAKKLGYTKVRKLLLRHGRAHEKGDLLNPVFPSTFPRISGTMTRNVQLIILTGKNSQMNNGKQQKCWDIMRIRGTARASWQHVVQCPSESS